MSDFDVTRFQFGSASAEERLIVIRYESLQRIPTNEGYGALLLDAIERDVVSERRDELIKYCQRVIDATRMLGDVVDALVVPQMREKRGIAELRPYNSLLNAVMDAAHKLDLPLAEALIDSTKLLVHSEYPLALLDYPNKQREVLFDLSQSRYRVQLLSRVDNQRFQLEGEVWPSSLTDVAAVINHYLFDKWKAEDIQKALT